MFGDIIQACVNSWTTILFNISTYAFHSQVQGRIYMNQTCNSESLEQQFLFRWCSFAEGKHPELKLLYHIPNEGKRSKATGGRMRAEGLKAGVPDLCLPVARGKYHGLYIEMKREKGSKHTDVQKQWQADLQAQGYCAIVCYGWEDAQRNMLEYLNLRRTL